MDYVWRLFLFAWAVIFFLNSCEDEGYSLSEDEVPRSNLPRVTVATPNQAEITRKIIHANISIENAAGMPEMASPMTIKGHGNTSWWEYPKKSYTLFFERSTPLLSMPEGLSWVLMANSKDVTLLRNDIAMFMGREMSHLDYTPDSRFTDLILNGRYWGIYQVFEALEVSPNRVDVGEDGFLLEIDDKARYDETIFFSTHLPSVPFNIKYPETIENDENYLFIKNYVQKAEDALYSNNFMDEDKGYRHYMDIDSFVDYYLINEISKNADAAFHTSCFLSLARGGKLKMGPLWDFDSAFGNYTSEDNVNSPDCSYCRDKGWFARLFQDPMFVALVKARFNDYYMQRQLIYEHIDEMSGLLADQIVWNNKVWGRLCHSSSSESKVLSVYAERVQFIKDWIERRMKSLKAELDEL